MTFVGFIYLRDVYLPTPVTVPQPGDPLDIRGSRIAIVRMVTRLPYEGIEIFEDHHAIRFPYPEGSPARSRRVVLSSEHYAQMEMLRNTWCHQAPLFRSLTAEEPFYDIGVRCLSYRVVQVKVPPDQLPAIFKQIQDVLPPP